MIEPRKMKDAVQHQDSNLVFEIVAVLSGLRPRAVDGNRDLAQKAIARPRGEREYVGRVVSAQEVAVQPLEIGVARDKTGERTAGDVVPEAFSEAAQPGAVQTWGATLE